MAAASEVVDDIRNQASGKQRFWALSPLAANPGTSQVGDERSGCNWNGEGVLARVRKMSEAPLDRMVSRAELQARKNWTIERWIGERVPTGHRWGGPLLQLSLWTRRALIMQLSLLIY